MGDLTTAMKAAAFALWLDLAFARDLMENGREGCFAERVAAYRRLNRANAVVKTAKFADADELNRACDHADDMLAIYRGTDAPDRLGACAS